MLGLHKWPLGRDITNLHVEAPKYLTNRQEEDIGILQLLFRELPTPAGLKQKGREGFRHWFFRSEDREDQGLWLETI